MKRIPLETATLAQLKDFAQQVLGLDVGQMRTKETLRAGIATVWMQSDILLVGEEHAAPAASGQRSPFGVDGTWPKVKDQKNLPVRVQIAKAQGKGGNEPVPLGVNGSIMWVPRGEPVIIPQCYAEALVNAIAFEYEPLPDGGINPTPIHVPAFPHSIFGPASHEQAKASAPWYQALIASGGVLNDTETDDEAEAA